MRLTEKSKIYLDRRKIFSNYLNSSAECNKILLNSSIGNLGVYENKQVSFHYFYLALEELTLLGFLSKVKLNFKTVGYKLTAKGIKHAEELGF